MPDGRAQVFKQLGGLIARPAYLPALIALIAVSLLGILADQQNRQIFEQHSGATVADQLSVLRARLEGNLNRDIQIGRAVVATLATRTRVTPDDFNALVGRLIEPESDLRLITAAPDMVVRMLYPLAGNEKVLGLDYSKVSAQREAAYRVKETRQMVLAGPVDLVQGGTGMIARFPVEIARPQGPPAFWGIISVVIDVTHLYENSGINAAAGKLDLTIRGRDGKGAEGDIFFGSEAIYAADPLTAEVSIPGGTWQLAATPAGGWPTPPNLLIFRLMIVLVGVLVVAPILVTGHLYAERRRHLDELDQRRRELEKMRNRAELALDVSAFCVWEHDPRTGESVWDRRMYELFGAEPDGSMDLYSLWRGRTHPVDRARIENAIDTIRVSGARLSETYRIQLPDGRQRVVKSVGAVLPESLDKIVIGVDWDVTEEARLQDELRQAKALADARNAQLEEANRQIKHASLHDELTGLPNRRYLTNYIERLSTGDQDGRGSVAILHIDLDRFKQVNDAFGHATGDRLLQYAAQLMRAVFRNSDLVARVGGDEFIAVCLGTDAEALAHKLAGDLIAGFRQLIDLGDTHIRSGVSVGIACAPLGESDLAKLLVDADIALYRAKQNGRNRIELFTRDLEAEVVTAKRRGDEILTGIEEGQFTAQYQPQVDATTRRLVGLEALVRWKHPTEGLIGPYHFLQLAEDIGILATLDHIVLETALADRLRWQADGLPVPRIAVNVSMGRLRDEGLIEMLERLAIPAGSLSFELTEALYLDDSDEIVTSNIRRLKDLGIEIEIDDFGTGYASIVSLMRLQPNRLKVAHQLTASVTRSPAQRQLIRSIVEIGKALEIGVVAEGVETAEQADILTDLGCDTLQGYVFGRPMDAGALLGLLSGVDPADAARQAAQAASSLFSVKL